MPLTIDHVPDLSGIERKPIRPLGKMSDFVATELPIFIQEIQNGNKCVEELSQIVEELCTDVDEKNCNTSLAHLDLFMLLAAIFAFEGTPGERLSILCECCTVTLQTVPVLTYEDLIYSNPLQDDPRIFTGESELFFYGAHRKIETVCSEIIAQLDSLLSCDSSPDYIADCLSESIQSRLLFIQNQMAQISLDLPEHDFKQMRPFFNAYGAKNVRGPSGNFSAGIFSIDSLIYGDYPEMQKFQLSKLLDLQYFSATTVKKDSFAGRNDMIRSHAKGLNNDTVHGKLTNQSEYARSVLRSIFTIMHNIRKVHFGLAMKFIVNPLVAEKKMEPDEIEGTAKYKLKEYLMKARDIYFRACLSVS